jgi:serine protease Do
MVRVAVSLASCLARGFRRAFFGPLIVLASVAVAETGESQRSVNVEKADQLRRDLREMIGLARDRVFPSLVNIKVITVYYWDGKEQKGQAVGSGTIISPDGYVLTNFHVADNGKKFKCTLADKQEISATLVGEDPLTDLAVLKLDLSELKDPKMELPASKFGDSDELETGDTVMAMGSPWALSRSVTLGIVSNTERILTASEDEAEEMRFDRDQRTGIFNRWIQHDAAINPGNSGGPLVNLKGELVGVNTRGTFFGGDMGFAIPSNVAKAVAAKLIEHGEVPRSWFGLSLKPIKKTGYTEGVLTNSIDDDGPADKAGLKAGDVILQIDNTPVNVWFPEEVPPLLKQLADYPVGASVSLTYRRGDQAQTAVIITERLKKDRGEEAAFRAWGMVALEITEKMARERRLDSTEGVLVQSVRGGSPAMLAEPPLMPDDVIRSIDGEKINDLPTLIQMYERITEAEKLPEYMLVEFDRRGKNHLTLVKPKPDKDVDPPREVSKAWIGVAVQPVLENLAKKLEKPESLGFRVTRVYPKTLAAQSDLRVGDIIVALNGNILRPRGMQDAGMFQRQVNKLDIDAKATLTILRDGEKKDVAVTLDRTRIAPEEARRDRNRDFEIIVREVTFFDRDEQRWDDDVRGVMVVDVESAGWAQLGGIRPGDLIQRIDDHVIGGLEDYRAAIEDVTRRQPERVVFVVLRGVRTHFQYLEPDWSPAALKRDETNNKEQKP